MFKINRKEKILELIEKEKNMTISQLNKSFGISSATIHRDLDELEREGRVKKVYGGVVLNIPETPEEKSSIRLNTNIELKEAIALKALEFVKGGDFIFIDNSTTCYYFAKVISKSNLRNITIITNSNLVASLFINNNLINVICTGGVFLKDLNCFAGLKAIDLIDEFKASKFFFSVAAVSINEELSDLYISSILAMNDNWSIKKEMFLRSEEKICLIDSTKFYKIGHRKLFRLSEIDKIITDYNCEKEKIKEFHDVGIELIIASR